MCKAVDYPGIILQSKMDADHMTQHDLAIRTGMSDKHISTIISGQKRISTSFAKRLAFVFDDSYSFWLEKQAEYDLYQVELAKENDVTEAEKAVLKELKEVYSYVKQNEILENVSGETEQILQLRKFLRIYNLGELSKVSYGASYRAQVRKSIKVNPNIVAAWQRVCEETSQKAIEKANSPLDINLLKSKLPEIKQFMVNESLSESFVPLQALLAECGIAFNIVKHFRGAPVQGCIRMIDTNKLLLCLTLRGAYADRFWFTFYHELGHIFNKDYQNKLIDFNDTDNAAEKKADSFAQNEIIPVDKYNKFIKHNNYEDLSAIKAFAAEVGVPAYMVIGRLQNDKLLDWSEFHSCKPLYKWAEI